MIIRGWICMCAVLLVSACAAVPDAGMDIDPAAQALLRDGAERMVVVAVANPIGVMPNAGSTLPMYSAMQRYAQGSPARATVQAIGREHHLTERVGWPIRALGLHCVVFEIAPGQSRDAVIAALSQDKRVEIAQPLQSFDTLTNAGARYNDPYVDLQRGFVEIEAGQAHRMSRGAGVLVAVIDTGGDTAHPDLQGRIASTRNFVDRDDAAFRQDRHGTQVAGVIAAVADNRVGIVGVAPEARVALYKACWQLAPNEAGARCSSFTLALALAAAIDDGASIINLSLGGPPDALLQRLVSQALKQGRIVVGAQAPAGMAAGFPANVAGVIAVDVAGRTSDARNALRAPGVDILTLMPGGGFDYASGSSIATAHVSAAAALLLGADPTLPAAGIRALLLRSQDPAAPSLSINACNALAALPGGAPCVHKSEQKSANNSALAIAPSP